MKAHSKKNRLPTPDDDLPQVRGITPSDTEPDADDVLKRMREDWQKQVRHYQKASSQSIAFKRGPISISFIGDLHLGAAGTDYDRVFADASLIAKTPRMYAVLCGDMLDNFIIPKLYTARADSHYPIQEEWAVVKKHLRIIAPKLLASVEGNHERWTYSLSAIPYFKEILDQAQPHTLFDSHDMVIDIVVGAHHFPTRIRHHWRTQSKYNATHGIEDIARFDQNFLIGVGAHTHQSGLIRAFDNAGANGYAVLCGSYKRFDNFAREKGFPTHNTSAAMTLILFEDGTIIPCDNLERAAKTMERYRR